MGDNRLKMSVTVVTCFFNTTKERKTGRGGLNEYWKPEVYKTKNPMVIYGDPEYIEYARSQRGDKLTEYHTMTMEQMELWKYKEQIDKNRQVSWPTRDDRCPSSVHIICCSKILFFRDAILSNPFGTDKFCFVDCNALGKSKASCIDLDERLSRVTDKFHTMIIGVPDKNASYGELYNRYQYILSGGIFASGREIGLFMADRFMEEFVKVTNAGYGHGEEMIWIKILYDHMDKLSLSYGDYSEFVTNFLEPLDNHHYILSYCITQYSNKRYYKELVCCCRKMLEVKMNADVHLDVLYYLYLGSYYLKNDREIMYAIDEIKRLVKLGGEYAKVFEYKREMLRTNCEFVRHLYNGKNPFDDISN